MEIDLSRFRAAFFEEAGEHLENMEAGLLLLEASGGDQETLNTIFRAAHSIKGAGSTFGMDQVARFTHVLENLLDRMREGEIKPERDLCGLLLKATDVLSGLIQAERTQGTGPADVETVYGALQQYSSTAKPSDSRPVEVTAEPAGNRSFHVRFAPSKSFFHFGQNPLFLIDELQKLAKECQTKADVSRIPPLSQLDPEACYLAWEMLLKSEHPEQALHDVFMFVDGDSVPTIRGMDSISPADLGLSRPAEPAAGEPDVGVTVGPSAAGQSSGSQAVSPAATQSVSETVRVDRDRLDNMINQIGELVIGTSMVEQDWMRFHPDMESSALVQLGKIVRDLQEMSLSLRMVPVAATFQKMARLVRDLSHRLGKQVRLETEGEDAELDKSVVDQIGDPLLHMVRNSIDHGIEMPEERMAAGKPAEGVVCLKAYHQSGNFIIEILDDGKGLDRDRILSKAVERGIVSENDTLTDDEIYGLIFAAGFSTAEKVTDVSGRGVGMDVVRRNVEALQGSISIRSVKGKGCRIIVRLPLTLAILDGLLVRVARDSYVIPLLSVVESIKPEPDQIQKVLGRGEVVSLRGEIVPLVRLDCVLNRAVDRHEMSDSLLVIVEDQGRKYALDVDELLGQQQVVIKNLEANFQKVPGIAGATILGDGRVSLILDINGLCALSSRPVLRPEASSSAGVMAGHTSVVEIDYDESVIKRAGGLNTC